MSCNTKASTCLTSPKWLVLLFALIFGWQANALTAPKWACIETQNNDVVLNWVQVNDPNGDFVQYEVYSLQNGLLSTITDITNTTFTDPSVSTVNDYYVVVVDNASANSSDTVQNIVLNLIDPGNGTAILTWNHPGPAILQPAPDFWYIYRGHDGNALTLHDSVPAGQTNFRDTIDICEAIVDYQIQIPGNGCMMTSNIESDDFEDMLTPDVPVVSEVTIDTLTGNVQIDWNDNSQPDTYGYIVYKTDLNGNLVEIDTVWGRFNSFYEYTENTSNGPLTYTIAAFDSCFTESIPPTYQTSAKAGPQTTVFLEGAFNPCLGGVNLNWTDYLGWGAGVSYTIFYTDENNEWLTEANSGDNNSIVYFDNNGTYRFVIRANHPDGRQSFSNLITLAVQAGGSVAFNYLASASVVGTDVELHHYVDHQSNVNAIAFERQQNDGSFKEIGRVAVTGPDTYYLDETANTDKSIVYRAVLVDSCGNKTEASNLAETMLLNVETNDEAITNTLSWNPYIGFDGGVLNYEIYRKIDGVLENTPIAVLPGNQTTFFYELDETAINLQICYIVVAVEGTNTYGFADYANSTEACATFEPRIYIPNAFSPEGNNPVFQPVFSFNEHMTYEMYIFNRWGKTVFSTVNFQEGWNGDLANGQGSAEPDLYLYTIIFTDENGEERIYRGNVTLIR